MYIYIYIHILFLSLSLSIYPSIHPSIYLSIRNIHIDITTNKYIYIYIYIYIHNIESGCGELSILSNLLPSPGGFPSGFLYLHLHIIHIYIYIYTYTHGCVFMLVILMVFCLRTCWFLPPYSPWRPRMAPLQELNCSRPFT